MAERVSSPVFVGRGAELARAEAGLRAAAGGRPAMFVVAGEAGVGKTRFAQELAARAPSDTLVLEGGCLPVGGEGVPLGPAVEALRSLARILAPDDLASLLRPARSDLLRLFPDAGAPGHDPAALGEPDSGGQGQLFEHLLLFLARLSAVRPVLLLLEDLHWADRSTLELLSFLGRNLQAARIVVVATYRSDELTRRHPLMPVLAELERAGRTTRINLGRFTRAEIGAQIEGILGEPGDPELVDSIAERSDGNAFHAEELVASGDTDALPDTLRDVLLARLARLSESTQEFLRVAAASGAVVAPELIAQVLDLPRSRIDQALREAISEHVVLPQTRGPEERYAFRHSLLREALYEELLPGERGRLHAALAEALTPRLSGSDATLTAEVAHHRQAAHDVPGAFDAWIAAAVAAEDLGAFSQALVYYERALDLWDRVADAATRSPLDRVDLLRRAALHAEGATPAKSLRLIREALALVDPAADPVRAGLLYERLGQYGTYTLPRSEIRAALQEAVRLIPSEPPSEARAWALAGLARFLVQFEVSDEAGLSSAAEAVEVAEAAGARSVQIRALAALGHALLLRGDVDAALDALRRGREIGEASGDVHELAGVLTWTVSVLYEAGRLQEAVDVGTAAETFAASHGLASRWAGPALLWVAEALIDLGRWSDADAALDRLARLPIHRRGQFELELRRLWLDARRGDVPNANVRLGRIHRLAVSGGASSRPTGGARPPRRRAGAGPRAGCESPRRPCGRR